MKTKNRILSFFLAFLMLFTTIMPAVTETVYAASVGTYFTFRLELLSYNYAGSKQRAGGKVYRVNGEVAYCIEPSIATATSENIIQYGGSIPSGYIQNDLSRAKIEAMQNVLLYGYKGDIYDYDWDAVAYSAATQVIIWEIASGCRSTSWPYYRTDNRWYYAINNYVVWESGDSCSWISSRDQYIEYGDYMGAVDHYYEYIEDCLADSYDKSSQVPLPSFMGTSSSGGSTVTLRYNSSTGKYEGSVTDTNGALNAGYYRYPTASGLTITRSGNTLYITSNSYFTGTKTASGYEYVFDHTQTYYRYIKPSGGSQRLLQMDSYPDDVYVAKYGYFKVKCESVPNKNITLTKNWSDNSNSYGIRPSSLVLYLYKNGSLYGQYTVSASNSWKVTVSVPDDGSSYTVSENAVTGYTGSTSGLTITNTIKTKQVTLTKTWSDSNNAYGLRPSSITLDLYKGSSKYGSYVLSSSNNWRVTVTVPNDGSTYTVREPNVPAGYTGSVSGLNATNTIKTKQITLTKNWSGDANFTSWGIRPSSIVLDVYKGSTKFGSYTLTAANNWKMTITVPDDGSTYTVREPNTPNGYTSSVSGLTATNTLKTKQITVTKSWVDENNKYNLRPANVVLDVYKGATKVTSVTLNSSNGWKATLTVPDDGSTYTVQEPNVPVGYNGSVSGLTATNTIQTKSITITKNWVDDSNSQGLRPTSISVNIYRNGTFHSTETITAANNWTKTISNLPKYNTNGTEIQYTVTEAEITLSNGDKYIPTVSNLTITNKLTGTTSLTINKTWEDNNNAYNTRPASINFNIYRNGSLLKTATLTGTGNDWTYTENNLPKYDDNGKIYSYTTSEINVPGYTSIKNGNNYINRTNETTSITINKTWRDEGNIYNTRPDSVQINVLQNGTFYKTITMTGTGNHWEYVVTDLPKYNPDGVLYTYTTEEYSLTWGDTVVQLRNSEAQIPGKSDSYFSDKNGNTFTNTLCGYVAIEIGKEWLDDEDAKNLRPVGINVNIARDDIFYGSNILNESNDWSLTISAEKYNGDGKLYNYSVTEQTASFDNQNVNNTNNRFNIPEEQLGDYGKNVVVEEAYYEASQESNANNANLSDYTFELQNKLVINLSLTVKKHWQDENNRYNTRPQNIDIKLKQNGLDYKTLTLSPSETAPNTYTWSITEIVPAVDDMGNSFLYTIEEVRNSTSNFYFDPDYNQEDYEVTNTGTWLAPDETPEHNVIIGKEIVNKSNQQAIDADYNKIGLDISENQKFKITLKELTRTITNTGTELVENYTNEYTGRVFHGLVTKDKQLVFFGLPAGKYEVSEEIQEYFEFAGITKVDASEKAIFSEENGKYYITLSGIGGTSEFIELLVKNQIDDVRYYTDVDILENLFRFFHR